MSVALHLPLASLDPIDRVYADLAARSAGQESIGVSIHSPLCFSRLAQPDEPPAKILSPDLLLTIVAVACDGTVFVSSFIGDAAELFTWRLSEAGVLLSTATTLGQLCELVGEQVAGSWLEAEASVAPEMVTILALALAGDRVLAGLHRTFEPGSGHDTASAGRISRELASAVEALPSQDAGESILLVSQGEVAGAGETWDIVEGGGDGDPPLTERLQELRATRVLEISVDLDQTVTLVATGPAGTVVVTELESGAARVRESRRGALEEVMAVCRAGGFGVEPGRGTMRKLAELFPAASDDPATFDDAPAPGDPRELVIIVTADFGNADGPVRKRMLFVDSLDGCYLVEEPEDLADRDGPLELPLVPMSQRGVLARIAAALRFDS